MIQLLTIGLPDLCRCALFFNCFVGRTCSGLRRIHTLCHVFTSPRQMASPIRRLLSTTAHTTPKTQKKPQKKWRNFRPPKMWCNHTTLATQFTTATPQQHHTNHPLLSKIPAKSRFTARRKNKKTGRKIISRPKPLTCYNRLIRDRKSGDPTCTNAASSSLPCSPSPSTRQHKQSPKQIQ
jgi:hypothetical protein